MTLLPHDPALRRELLIGALVAVAILVTSAAGLPQFAMGVLPGLWVVLRADRRPCRRPTTPLDRAA